MKFYGNSRFNNVLTYTKLAVLIFLVVSDSYAMDCLCEPQTALSLGEWIQNLFSIAQERFNVALDPNQDALFR